MNEDDDLLKKILGLGKSAVSNLVKSFNKNIGIESAIPFVAPRATRNKFNEFLNTNKFLNSPTPNPNDAPDVTPRSATGAFIKTAPQEFGDFLKKGIQSYVPKPVQKFTQPIANAVGNTGQVVASGVTDVVDTVRKNLKPSLSISEIIKNTAQGVYGAGKVAAAGTPLFQGANAASQLPSKSSVIPRVSQGVMRGMTGIENLGDVPTKPINLKLGDFEVSFDPADGIGQMVGFIKNPVNSKIFGATEKLVLPISGKVVNFLATNAVRGGIENFLMDLKNLPEDATPQEKALFLAKTTALGAGMEIGGRTITEAIPEFLTAKIPALATIFDELKASIKGREAEPNFAKIDVNGQPRTPGGQYDFINKKPIFPDDIPNLPGRPKVPTGDITPENAKTGDTIRFDQRYGDRFPVAGAKSAMGGFAGIEEYQDENGDTKFRINPEKAMIGMAAAGFLSTKGHLSDIMEIVKKTGTGEESVNGIKSLMDYKLSNLFERLPKEGDNAIKDLKGLRAAVNKTMYELAGVDPKNGLSEGGWFQTFKNNPEVKPAIDALEGYIEKIDELISGGVKSVEDLQIKPQDNTPISIDELFGKPKPTEVNNMTKSGGDEVIMKRTYDGTTKEYKFSEFADGDGYLYHATSPEKLDQIMVSGLKTNPGYQGRGVYFAPDEASTTGQASYDGAVVRVNINKLDPKKVSGADVNGFGDPTEIVYNEAIPTSAIEVKTKDGWQPVIKDSIEVPPTKPIDKLFEKPQSELSINQPSAIKPKTADEIIARVQQGIEEPQNMPKVETTQKVGSELPPGETPPNSGTSPKVQSSTWLNGITSKLNNLYTRTINRLHPLTEIAKMTGDKQDLKNMQWAITSHYGAGSTANYHVDFELAPILNKVDDINALKDAAIAMRDIELTSRGIKGSPEQAKAVQTLQDLNNKYGAEKMQEYGNTLKELYQYQSNMVKKYLVDTGIMGKKAYEGMTKNNQFYVPFKRVMDDVDEFLGVTPQSKGVGSVSGQNVIFGIKGSDKEIQDPIESIVENTYKMVGLAKRQEVAQTIVGLKDKLPEGLIREVQGRVGNKNVVALFENGKVKHYEAPVEVVEAAKGLREEALNNIVRWLSVPTQWFRATATAMNPEFAIPNTFRDLQTAFVNIGLNPFGFVRGLTHLMNKDDVYQKFLMSGAQTSRVALDRPFLKKTVEDITNKGVSIKSVADIGKVLQTMGEVSEQPTRIAVWEKAFNDAIKNGMDEASAMKDAALKSQEVTTNFARRGSDTQSLNALYAFVNARAQGTDQLLRSFKNDPAGVTMRLGLITVAPAVTLYMYNNRFESYQDERVVTDADKRDNFIFMLSDKPIEALGGAQFIKIPKGDVGRVANPVEAFMDYAIGEGGDVLDSTLQVLSGFSPIDVDTPSQAAGSIVPTALKPLVEVGLNKNFYFGNEIVPNYKKDYPAGFQDNSYTSPFFRMVGQKLGISPAKLQNIAQGYGTGWVRIADMLLSKVTPKEYFSAKNEQGAPINTIPVARRFLGGERRSEEEQMKINQSKAENIKKQISTVRNAIKKGTIPYDEGMKQIEKLQSGVSVNVKGASTEATGDIDKYVQLYDLSKYTQANEKTGIAKYEAEKGKLSEARKIYTGSGDYESIPEEDRMKILTEGFGIEAEKVKYDVYANADTDVKVSLITEEATANNLDHKQLLQTLFQGRAKSISGKQYVTDGVLDALYSEGLITNSEKKYLKKVDPTKDGKLRVSGGGTSTAEKKKSISDLIKAMEKPKVASVDDLIKASKSKVPYKQREKVGINTNLAKLDTPESITGGSSRVNVQDLVDKSRKSAISAKARNLVRGGGGYAGSSTPKKLSKSFYKPKT